MEESGIVLEDPLPDYVRPVGLATLGRNSHFARPYRIRSPHRIHVGDDVWVGRGIELSVVELLKGVAYDPVLRIGDRCALGRDIQMSCVGEIDIAPRVWIAARVYIGDTARDYSDPTLLPEEMGLAEPLPIRIDTGVFLGTGSVVLPGVTIGERAVVSANAVVTRDVPPRTVVFGNPARVVRSWDAGSGQWVTGPPRGTPASPPRD